MARAARGSRPTVVDLFAGAGLFSYAFAKEGFSVQLAVEQNKHAAETYAANLDAEVVVDDVARVEPSGTCDVLIAGPPCQGFSTLGKRNPKDPRNRLSYRVAAWAEALRPRVVVIENVAAFLDSPIWAGLARRFRALGYEVTSHVCDALDYGVPQRRKRSATFASLVGPIELKPRRRTPVTVREAWDDLPMTPSGSGMDVYLPTSELALGRMKVIPEGGGKADIIKRAPHLVPPSWLRDRTEITDVWGRMEWDKPSNTLRTQFVNPSKGRYIHPEQHRVMSLREAARLQSIPDEFMFAQPVPYIAAKQIGNSVPPKMGRAIARAVSRALG